MSEKQIAIRYKQDVINAYAYHNLTLSASVLESLDAWIDGAKE